MEHVDIFPYELFLKLNKYLHFGQPKSYTTKKKWVRSTAQAYRETGGYFVVDRNPVNNQPFSVLDIYTMFSAAFEQLNQIFLSYADVTNTVSLDEIMTASFSLANPFMSFNKGKTDKYGIGFFCLCCAFSHYLIRFLVLWPSYMKPATIRPVMGIMRYLLEPFYHTNITVVVDNFYCSLSNVKQLLELGIYTVGVVRRDRLSGEITVPVLLRPFTKMQQIYVMEHKFSDSNLAAAMITLLLYYEKSDKKVCCFLSSSNAVSFSTETARPHHRRRNMVVTSGGFTRSLNRNERPTLVDVYNKRMCGVDLFYGAMHSASLAIPYRNKKFWLRRLMFRIFTMMVTSCFIKFRSFESNQQYNFPVFRYHLSFAMVSMKCTDVYVPPFSIKSKQRNCTRTLCTKCRSYSRHAKRSLCRTKQQCIVCSRHICPDFYLQYCNSCASDHHMNAIPSVTIEKYTPVTKTTCASSACRIKTKSTCAYCLKTYCESHLHAICTDCSPVTHP